VSSNYAGSARPALNWWHRLPACALHRQDAGATKNFLKQDVLINHHHANHHQRRSGG
jgi:hypothetical protein